MKPNKENSMLIDIQYIKPNKKNDEPDVLYVIWKDLDTGKKYMQKTEEPKMDIYFEKAEYRNHTYNRNYQHLDKLYKDTVKYKDIVFRIAEEMGEMGKARLNDLFRTGDYRSLNKFHLYPYVFGSDFDIRGWYRAQWLKKLDNSRVKKLDKGFLDIEVDGFGCEGLPIPTKCPINAVTILDGKSMTVHTFLLINQSYHERNTSKMSQDEIKEEMYNRRLYQERDKQIQEILDDVDGFKQELHDMFDENYPNLKYELYFYSDERKMLVHLFQLINILKLDIIGIWNMPFDIPYIMERLAFLGLDPKEVMTHPDFPIKECRFKLDTRNFEIKNKTDFFYLSSYTTFCDQMVLYAAIRKGQQELRSHKLNFVARKELKDEKLNYSEDGDIKTLPYTNYKLFVKYNIKDVLLQYGIEARTSDFDTYYVGSYKNATPYDGVFKQTVKLRNVQLVSYDKQGLVPGNNINIFNISSKPQVEVDSDEDDEDSKFEGALVARPELNSNMGINLYGHPSNNIFIYCIDMDMSAFYPNSIIGCNIDPSTLIFKAIIERGVFKQHGSKLKEYISPYDKELDNRRDNDDIAKEIFDNLQTGNNLSVGYKTLNLPSVDEVFAKLKNKLG